MGESNSSPILHVCGADDEARQRVVGTVRELGGDASHGADLEVPETDSLRGIVLAADDPTAVQHWMTYQEALPAASRLPWMVLAPETAVIEVALAVGASDFLLVNADDVTLRQRIRCFMRMCRKLPHERPEEKAPDRDALTGLATRVQFVERLHAARAQASRRGERLAVLHVDVDRFGAINESLGRSVGDHLLGQVGERLAACLRDGDTVARPSADELSRLGGDEFMLALPSIDSTFDPGVVAARLTEAIREPFEVDDTEIFVTASVGIAISPDDARAVEDLIECAQTAARHAKNEGGNAYMFYSARMNADTAARLDLAAQLHRGLADEQFELVYQPVFESGGEKIACVEALLRWQHPREGLVLPGTFVPVAEETGLILPLGNWVIEQACRQWREWLDGGIGPVRVSINISPRQFHDPGFLGKIDDAIEAHGVDPTFLQFELTEGVLMNGGEAAQATTMALKERGCGLAVDDFGTGYSSLNYLRDFPADVLKIDRSFVAGIPEDQENCSLVAAIVAMAHKLRLSVVAEGVETEAQLRFLRALDCEQVQGFLLGRPAPPVEIEAQLLASLDGSARNVIAFRRRHAAS